ncbi:MAG: biotin/lipoyl-binding carrier protein [Lachnospiraceae bacterium]|nr:biotin/lipoyl-binding carrier protein [Lachnospiraceae bacterium]
MKSYTITVNGTAYAVTVEEGACSAPAAAPVAAPVAAAGSVEVAAQVAGMVWKVVAKVGDSLKKGDNIVILEAMKMEIPVVAPEDGVVAGINVSEGDTVNNGDLIASLN